MWAVMALIVLLFFLSIYGAFLGPKRAKEFFNSVPLAVFWIAFILLLAIGIALFRRLLRVPALLLVHIGCIFVLAGALWGSVGGHEFRRKLLGIDKIPSGYMQIYEGHLDNRVIMENNKYRELPFYIGLKDFRIEYYKPQYLRVQSRQGDNLMFPVKINTEYPLNSEYGAIKILRIFENFKIQLEGENRTAIDDSGPGSNPALEIEIQKPEGQIIKRYVFERFPGHVSSEDGLYLSYERIISEYTSELYIIRDGQVVAEKNIQVNHPLHYGGYHIYQQDYDHQAGLYTILKVTSDSGLIGVYAGYLMLCAGLCWHFWINKLPAQDKQTAREDSKSQ